ncbi:acetyl esterase [Chryseobacterium taichungense]|uniref:Acetyl esterase n=1 Tax=Chryseobacterium taichungense TaxID=295069 RepID=A0A1H7XF48_9FLAO|nr:alpha/beta hydrolase [Chryseobacterium taichungense]SEM32303.1 acetyl esterase [Chryseobacterium taichungense]
MKKLVVTLTIAGLVSCKTIKQSDKMSKITLTPEITKIVENLQKIHVFEGGNPLDVSRKGYETMAIQLGGKKEAVRMIEEFDIPQEDHEIPVRIYRPNGIENEKSSAIIYLHGGWFVSGSFETHDAIVRQLANATGAAIIFVDYRLAPENPFPAGFDDARSVTQWIIDNADHLHLDKNKIGVIGDSAGGALAASLSTQIGDQLKFQVLIYPAADNRFNTTSWKEYENGPIINKEEGIRAWNWYLANPKDQENPLAIPLLIKDFKNTPPTLVLLSEHDPLRDEGQQLAENMRVSGVQVKTVVYKEMVHGFMHMGAILKETREAAQDIAAFTKENSK